MTTTENGPRLTLEQHRGITREADKRMPRGYAADYLILRARMGAFVFLGATYGIMWDGQESWERFTSRLCDAITTEWVNESEAYTRAIKATEGSS